MAFWGWGGINKQSGTPSELTFQQPLDNHPKILIINGYEIDAETGTLRSVSKGQKKYVFPKEVKKIQDNALENAYDTAEIVDFSNTQLHPHDLIDVLVRGFKCLKQIKVPESFETIHGILGGSSPYDYLTIIENNGRRTINIPKNLKTFKCSSDSPWNEDIILPYGIREVEDFDHNNCIKKIDIPGTLTSKTLPEIYQINHLRELIIGEGIEKVSSGHCYYGLNRLSFVSIPSTLNSFNLARFETRAVNYPNTMAQANEYQEELTIEKKFGKESWFGEGSITFKIPRKMQVGNGYVNISFDSDRVVINGYPILYATLSPNGTYYVDYNTKTIKSLTDEQYTEETDYLLPESYLPKLEIDFETKSLEVILNEIDSILRELLLHSPQILNSNSNEKIRALLRENLGKKIDWRVILSKVIELLRNRGINIKNGLVVCYALQADYYMPILEIYIEILFIDYIITELMRLLGKEKTIEYLTNIMRKSYDELDYIKLNLQNIPLQMISYAPLITPPTLLRVITYCGIKPNDKTSVIEYIEGLEKRRDSSSMKK